MKNQVYDLLSLLCDPYHSVNAMEDDENDQELFYKNYRRTQKCPNFKLSKQER